MKRILAILLFAGCEQKPTRYPLDFTKRNISIFKR